MSHIDRRKFVATALAAGAGMWISPRLGIAQQTPLDPESSAVDMMTVSAQKAIDRGLDFLAGRQQDDGAFGTGGYNRNVAVCGLAGMAFMSSGSTPMRGPYGEYVNRCVEYILANTSESGFIQAEGASSHGPMYGHGFAALFLAEVYGMTMEPLVRENLVKAVQTIVDSQNPDGGWRYHPAPRDADISVTVSQVMALRAARNAGIHVPDETIERCIDYVKRCQNPDGGFVYMLNGGESAFPRSAAGIVALYSAGIYEGEEITKGLDYLMKHLPRTARFSREAHYFYGHYYAVQAMWHAGGDYWQSWYPAIRDALIERQLSDGHWMDMICPEYGTAMATIILQMPNNYLPIFQR